LARRRFFVPDIRRDAAELGGAEAEHLVRVLRVEVGQVFEISDNRNVYLAEITTARKSLVVFAIQEQLPSAPAQAEINLYAALFKFDRFELLVEKATELGVASIYPVQTTRSEAGLAQASAKRRQRWEKIALEASQQSRRDHLPVVHEALAFGQAVKAPESIRLLLDEAQGNKPLLSVLPSARNSDDRIAIFLGPEGGWTDTEREAILAAGWTAASLGPTILRAETAGVAALAIVQSAWQNQA
jgi:16S rRNA (uracil1498-N3)-methyltransferase